MATLDTEEAAPSAWVVGGGAHGGGAGGTKPEPGDEAQRAGSGSADSEPAASQTLGYIDGGLNLVWRPVGGLAVVFEPRLTTSWNGSARVGWNVEQLAVGLTAPKHRVRAALGLQRPSLGLESPDEWENTTPAVSRFRDQFQIQRHIGLSVTLAPDSGWEFAGFAGTPMSDGEYTNPVALPDPGLEPWSVDTAPYPVRVVFGSTVFKNDVATEFRTGWTLSPVDGVARARLSMSWFVIDALSFAVDTAVDYPYVDGKVAGGGLLEVAILPGTMLRPEGRLVYVGAPDSVIDPLRIGGGASFVTGDSNVRLSLHVDTDIFVAKLAPGQSATTHITGEATLWFGEPQQRDSRNVDPTTLGVQTNPHRIFGSQP